MSLERAVEQAWRAFDRAAELSCRVTPAAPILFFGDLKAYRASPLRILTVGKNPSLEEFPADGPFRRFPSAEGNRGRKPSRYLDAMSAYFRTDPYRSWFSAFEPLLNGMDASYYEGSASTALHTDICSPVATAPKWDKLGDTDRAALVADGGPLWHMLLKTLQPQIVVLSVAKEYLERIEFVPMTDWKVTHTFKRTGNGDLRARPYEVRARWYKIGGEQTLFVFGTAAQKPFGSISNEQKRQVGQIAIKAYRNG